MLSVALYYFFGLSASHINRPDAGVTGQQKLPVRYNFHTTYTPSLSDKSLLQLGYYFSKQHIWSSHRITATAVLWKYLISGLGYSDFNDVQVILGARNNCLSFVVSYNASYSIISEPDYPSWEVHLGFNLRNRENRHTLTVFERM